MNIVMMLMDHLPFLNGWIIPIFTILFFTGIISSLFYVAELFLSIGLPVMRTIKCINYLNTHTRRRRTNPTLVPENLLCYWVIFALLQLFPWQHVPYAKQFRFFLFAGLQLALFDGQYGYVLVYRYVLEPHLQMYEGTMNHALHTTDRLVNWVESVISSR